MLRGHGFRKWKRENWKQKPAPVVSLCDSWGTAWHPTDLAWRGTYCCTECRRGGWQSWRLRRAGVAYWPPQDGKRRFFL